MLSIHRRSRAVPFLVQITRGHLRKVIFVWWVTLLVWVPFELYNCWIDCILLQEWLWTLFFILASFLYFSVLLPIFLNIILEVAQCFMSCSHRNLFSLCQVFWAFLSNQSYHTHSWLQVLKYSHMCYADSPGQPPCYTPKPPHPSMSVASHDHKMGEERRPMSSGRVGAHCISLCWFRNVS